MRYLILLAVLPLWTGCKGGVDKTLEQALDERHPLESTGTLRIKNVDGAIRLYGSDVSEVHIEATKKAYSAERLRAIKMQVVSNPGLLSIETIFPARKKWSLHDRSGVVDYVIVIPQHLKQIELELMNGEISIEGLRGGSAHCTVVNGRLSARNCFANLDYEARNGAIDFYYNWWEAGRHLVQATIPNGAIGVFLPRDASFRVEAETQGGDIVSNLIDEDEKPRDHRKTLMRTFGATDAPTFHFKTANGNIRIRGY